MEILLKLAFELTDDSSWCPGWLLEGIPAADWLLQCPWVMSLWGCPPVVGWFLCEVMMLWKSFSDFFTWLQVSQSFLRVLELLTVNENVL